MFGRQTVDKIALREKSHGGLWIKGEIQLSRIFRVS